MRGLRSHTKERRRYAPITSGWKPVAELARLRAQGLDWWAVARGWGMRPQRGGADLFVDAVSAWENAGSPDGPARPADDAPDAAFREWERLRRLAVDAWLSKPAERSGSGPPLPDDDWEPCDATA